MLARSKPIKTGARSLALVGMMAATLTGGKLALAALPNIEIVTLLTAVYGFSFGAWGLAAVLIFVLCELMIWGMGPWFVSYLVYWPLVCSVFIALRSLRVSNVWAPVLAAVTLTLFFGVLTSLVDVGLLTGYFDNFWLRFSIYYTRGVVFYAIHVAGNAVLFAAAFAPLAKTLTRHTNKPLAPKSNMRSV